MGSAAQTNLSTSTSRLGYGEKAAQKRGRRPLMARSVENNVW